MLESTILVTNKANTRMGEYDKLTTWLLLGETNTNQAEVPDCEPMRWPRSRVADLESASWLGFVAQRVLCAGLS